MSLRHQRRLRQQAVVQVSQSDAFSQSSEGNDESSPMPIAKPSNFDLLASSDSDNEQIDEANVDTAEPDMTAQPQAQQARVQAKISQSRKSTKRKADALAAADDDFSFDDDSTTTCIAVPTMLDTLLTLTSSTCTNADAELVRTFGRVPAAAQAPEGAAVFNPRMPRAGRGAGASSHHGGSGLAFVTPDSMPSNGQGWPFVAAPSVVAGGFSMQSVDVGPQSSFDCSRWFTLADSGEYRSLLHAWEAIGGTGDPQLTHDFAAKNLYCVSAMVGLAEYYRTVRQPDAAVIHLRRALFTLEKCLHPAFKPWDAKQPCRMAYGATERNREFYNLLFKAQARSAIAGAYDASFHLCKLLLQLSPPPMPSSTASLHNWGSHAHSSVGGDEGGDPLRVALIADTAALRCGQDEWVLGMTGAQLLGTRQTYVGTLRGTSVPLVMLPGWALARARALFRLQQGFLEGKTTMEPSQGNTALPASSSEVQTEAHWMHGDCSFLSGPTSLRELLSQWAKTCEMGPAPLDPASATAVRTLLVFPHVLLPLLTALGFKREDKGLTSVLGDVSLPKASSSGGGTAATRRSGEVATPSVSMAAQLRQHCLPPSLPQCAWAPIFDHPLFAQPYQEYVKIRAGELDCGSAPSDSLFGSARGCAWFTHEGLETIITITARRHAQVWRSPPALLWLHACAMHAMKAYDSAQALDAGGSGGSVHADGTQRQQQEVQEETVLAAAEAFTARAWFREVYGHHDVASASAETGVGPGSSGPAAVQSTVGLGPSARMEQQAIHACMAHYGSAGPLHDYTDEKEPTMDADMAAGGGDGDAGHVGVGAHGAGRGGRRAFRGYCGCSALWNRIAAAAGYNPLVVLFASLFPGYRPEGE